MKCVLILSTLGVLAFTYSAAFGDACPDVAGTQCTTGKGSDHITHDGYACTTTVSDEIVEDFSNVRSVEKTWDATDVNCGCDKASATYSASETHTNTTSADLNASTTIKAGVSATVGASLAGLAKAQASSTAEWSGTVGGGWGYESTDEEQLTSATGFQALKCSEWHYNKWYWKGTPTGTADLFLFWSDGQVCWNPATQSYNSHLGSELLVKAITTYSHGLKTYDGSYAPHGQGFQNWDVRCEKCITSSFCYKYECPDECGSCEE